MPAVRVDDLDRLRLLFRLLDRRLTCPRARAARRPSPAEQVQSPVAPISRARGRRRSPPGHAFGCAAGALVASRRPAAQVWAQRSTRVRQWRVAGVVSGGSTTSGIGVPHAGSSATRMPATTRSSAARVRSRPTGASAPSPAARSSTGLTRPRGLGHRQRLDRDRRQDRERFLAPNGDCLPARRRACSRAPTGRWRGRQCRR